MASNYFNNPSIFAAEALTILKDKMIITALTSRDKTADFMAAPNGYAVGSTVNVKTYGDFEVNEFTGTTVVQGVRNSTRPMTIEKHYDVSVAIGAKEQALSFDGFAKEVLTPAMARLAEKCDKYVGSKLVQAAGLYTSASLFTTTADMALARKAATLQSLDFNRICLTDLDLESVILGQTAFTQAQTGGTDAEERMRNGMMGRLMGMDFYSSIGFPVLNFTSGTGVTTVDSTVATNNLIGLSVLTVAALTGSLAIGDRIAVAGAARPLVVAAAAVPTATTITLRDPITEVLTDGAAVTTVSTTKTWDARGVIMDDRSISVATPMLEKPSDKPSSVVSEDGFSLRIVSGYDIATKKELMSIDIIIGAAAYDPRRMTLVGDEA